MRSFEEVSREGLVEIIKEGEQIIVLQSNTIARLEADKARLVEALKETLTMHENAMESVDWGKSFFNASVIRSLNEVPIKARALLAEMEKSND